MADELVKRLRNPTYYTHPTTEDGRLAADRIEQLTAERDGLLRCVTDNHVALCRAEKAEAERDRLREALEDIIADCEADYPPSHGAIKYAARAALKGEAT